MSAYGQNELEQRSGIGVAVGQLLVSALLLAGLSTAQTTQGLISGSVFDLVTGQPLSGATIEYATSQTHGSVSARSDGSYDLPLLAPGIYSLGVSKAGYQPRLIYELRLTVGGYISVRFQLRPLEDVWERNVPKSIILGNQSVLSYLGPDVDPSFSGTFDPEPNQRGQLEPSISEVIDPAMIATLPLPGRDAYTALVWMPGVATDTGTARSLGLSANGQRPTSSNFLLDGVEFNNHLISGPAISVPPEGISEYRVSTNNFSAEYGGTSGYIANAVTRSGGSKWHGLLYSYLENDVLNANTFQNNVKGMPRTPLKETQSGFNTGGPVPGWRNLFSSTSFEYFRSRSFDSPATYELPTQSYAESLGRSLAGRLLLANPPAQWGPENGGVAPASLVTLRPSVSLDRITGVEHVDYQPSNSSRFMLRLAAARLSRPDFLWTPYGDSALKQVTFGVVGSFVKTWNPALTSEVRAGYQRLTLNWRSPLADVPSLEIIGGPIDLPGQSSGFAFSAGLKSSEVTGSVVYTRGRNLLKAGGSIFGWTTQSVVSRKPTFIFRDAGNFAADSPSQLISSVSLLGFHNGNQISYPQSGGIYGENQFSGFVQDDFRWSPRFTINLGLRVDHFGAPENRGATSETTVALGPGASIDDRIHNANLVGRIGSSLYRTDPADWAGRFGFAYSFLKDHPIVVRGGFGIFYDRPYANLWSSAIFNDIAKGSFALTGTVPYLGPLSAIYPAANLASVDPFYNVTIFQSQFRSSYTQSLFLGAEREIARHWSVQVNLTGSLGRRLLTNDIWNRDNPFVPFSRPNINLPDLNYRGTQGSSDYSALVVSSRYASKRGFVQGFYTWSHSIDNQSDPLLGDFFDLGLANQVDRNLLSHYFAGFTYPYDSRVDRGNSDFDQRHNFVLLASRTLDFARGTSVKQLFRNWTISGVYALRSGLPYTILTGGNCAPICNTRATLVEAEPFLAVPINAPGGKILLDQAAFQVPPPLTEGNLGRNSLRGPGFQNLDLSIARSFAISRLGEAGRLTVRADAYNALNHTNLSSPQAFLRAPDFGFATYGRIERGGFPALTPLNETARQVELLLRLEF
jgi:Carboxypeptidase regulatory-like domain/TonB-dependent Receptor Plug Domain